MKFRVTPSVLSEWRLDECASWEDARRTDDPMHPYNILDRHRGEIEVRNAEEAAVLLLSVHWHGDTLGYDPDTWPRKRAMHRYAERIRAAFPEAEELVRRRLVDLMRD